MLKCEIGKNITCRCEVEGNVLELTNDVLNLLGAVHKNFEKYSPEEAEIFRLFMLRAMREKDWSKWTDDSEVAEDGHNS